MTENDSLFGDFYDCNSSSNSFLKFESNSPLFELSPQSTDGRTSPASPLASTTNSNDNNKMDSSHNNPLLSTASMPIPTRNISLNSTANNNNNNNRLINDFSEIIFDFENSRSPLSAISEHPTRQHQTPMMINYSDTNTLGFQQNDAFNTGVMWDNVVSPMMNVTVDSSGTSGVDINDKPFRMDEDDIFQVDKSDLIQDPTLAELNGDGNLYVDLLNIDELIANDSSHYMQQNNMQNLTQLSSVNFQNLQNAIEASQADQLSPNHYQTIAIPQTPHNTPIPSFHTSGGKIIFCDDPNSLFSPTNQLTISTNIQNVTNTSQLAAFSPESQSSTSTSSIALNSSLSPPPSQSNYTPTRRQPRVARGGGAVQYNPKYSTLHSLLMKKDPSNTDKDLLRKIQQASQNQASSSTASSSSRRLQLQSGSGGFSRLSSSAPTTGFEQIWQRREPKPHLLSTGSLAEGQGSTSSLSGDVLSPENENIDYSQDDEYSDEDSDHYEDYSSGEAT